MENRCPRATLLLIAVALGGIHDRAVALTPSGGDDFSDIPKPAPAIHVTRLDYSKFDVPESVTVITQDEIREAGYLKISEIFRAVPGFRIINIGDEARVSYHGTTARQVRRMLVTIDGRSVLVGDSEYVEFNHLPIALEDIERITVTRGPNGAAYGDNAFLVSIDIRTVGRDDPQGVTLRAGAGHNRRERIGTSVNEQIGDFQLAFSAGRELDGGYDYFDATRTPRDDGLGINRGVFSLTQQSDPDSRWRLDANFFSSQNKTGIRALSFTGTERDEGQYAALSNQREIGDASRLDWYFSYYRHRENVHNTGCYTPEAIARTSATVTDPQLLAGLLAPTLFVPTLLGTSLENTCFFTDLGIDSSRKETGLEFDSRHGRWRYLFGTSANLTNASSAQYFAGRAESQRSYRGFGEADLAAGPVHASVGAMVQDSSNVRDSEPAWRGALSWQFLPNQALRYSYARSFRIPSLRETEILWTGAFDFGRRDEPQSSYPINVPLPLKTQSVPLKPETIDSNSVGYFGSFWRSSATVDVKVFTETIHNPIESSLFYFSPPPSNGSPFTIKGAEMEAVYQISEHWKISGQYSYLDNNTQDPIELGLQSRYAGSVRITYRPFVQHAIAIAYYGNSNMSGHSYARYDFVYNYSSTLWSHLVRSKVIWQHHIDPAEGIRDPNPLLSDEGYFAHLDQLFLSIELAL